MSLKSLDYFIISHLNYYIFHLIRSLTHEHCDEKTTDVVVAVQHLDPTNIVRHRPLNRPQRPQQRLPPHHVPSVRRTLTVAYEMQQMPTEIVADTDRPLRLDVPDDEMDAPEPVRDRFLFPALLMRGRGFITCIRITSSSFKN